MAPMIVASTYLVGTLLIFRFGPWDWPVQNSGRLWLFLSAVNIAFILGYIGACRLPAAVPHCRSAGADIGKLIFLSLLANTILYVPTFYYRTGTLSPDLHSAFVASGFAYEQSQIARASSDPLVEYVRCVMGPILVLAMPLTVFYWSRMNLFLRLFGLSYIIGYVILFVAMGTNKGLMDVMIQTPVLICAAYYAGYLKLNLPRAVGLGVLGMVAMLGFLLFVRGAVYTRPGRSAENAGMFLALGLKANTGNAMVRWLPDDLKVPVISVSSYLTQGYYALSLCLDEPFVPMYGLGNSVFLCRNVARLTGNEAVLQASYPVRIEKDGWDAYGLWTSMYPWIASDVSFPGTVIVMYILGRLFALTWLDTLRGDNPYAVVLFSLLVNVIVFSVAHNWTVASGEGFTGFWCTLMLWARSRRQGV